MKPIIVATDLAAGYAAKPIWQNANFSVQPGEFIGLLGSNGAGKTTLFRMLLGLARPLQGKITIFGDSPTSGNSRIGYVPQRHIIDTETKIASLEYVRLGINGNKWGIGSPSAARTERQL